MISTAWAAPWASACISSASLIVIPSKPSSPRSVPSNTARDRVAGRVGSPVSPGTAMCDGHDGSRARRDGRPERDELVRLDVVAAAVDDAQAVVGVVGRGAQPREVLDRCGHTGRLEPAHHRRPVPGDRRRIAAERADPEGRIRRLGRQVERGRVDEVDAHRARLAPDRGADPLGQGLVIGRAERHVAGELGRLGTERDELAALLIRGDEQRAGRGRGPIPGPGTGRLEGLGQRPDLVGPQHVDRHEQGDAGDRRIPDAALHPVRQPVALEGEHHALQDAIAACHRDRQASFDPPRDFVQ